jgi:hypothetical protein
MECNGNLAFHILYIMCGRKWRFSDSFKDSLPPVPDVFQCIQTPIILFTLCVTRTAVVFLSFSESELVPHGAPSRSVFGQWVLQLSAKESTLIAKVCSWMNHASLGLDHQHSQQIYVEMRIPMLFDLIISNDYFPWVCGLEVYVTASFASHFTSMSWWSQVL